MIAQVAEHWIRPEAIEQTRMLYRDNGKAMKTSPGFVMRFMLISKSDPLKITTISVWRDEESQETWIKNTNHIRDNFGRDPVVPPGTEYHEKFHDQPSPLAKTYEMEHYDVIEASL